MRSTIGYLKLAFQAFSVGICGLVSHKASGVSFFLLFTVESSGNRSHASYEQKHKAAFKI